MFHVKVGVNSLGLRACYLDRSYVEAAPARSMQSAIAHLPEFALFSRSETQQQFTQAIRFTFPSYFQTPTIHQRLTQKMNIAILLRFPILVLCAHRVELAAAHSHARLSLSRFHTPAIHCTCTDRLHTPVNLRTSARFSIIRLTRISSLFCASLTNIAHSSIPVRFLFTARSYYA